MPARDTRCAGRSSLTMNAARPIECGATSLCLCCLLEDVVEEEEEDEEDTENLFDEFTCVVCDEFMCDVSRGGFHD